jgi:hypothetical protein
MRREPEDPVPVVSRPKQKKRGDFFPCYPCEDRQTDRQTLPEANDNKSAKRASRCHSLNAMNAQPAIPVQSGRPTFGVYPVVFSARRTPPP